MGATGDERVLFANLRRLGRSPRPNVEKCELCSAELASQHQHLLDTQTRGVLCSCDACAILFPLQQGQSYRRIPRYSRFLSGFAISDAQWQMLNIPIDLAFFCRTGLPSRPVAYYPSVAGAVQSLLSLESWDEIVANNRVLDTMEAEVEALLINRTTTPHEYYLLPIDECYRLVGLIRQQWRGFSGGKEMWQTIAGFFISLKQKAKHVGGDAHA